MDLRVSMQSFSTHAPLIPQGALWLHINMDASETSLLHNFMQIAQVH